MKIRIDYDRCMAAGACVVAAPTVFDQDEEDGRVILLDTAPDEKLLGQVLEAARLCPARIIEVDEPNTPDLAPKPICD